MIEINNEQNEFEFNEDIKFVIEKAINCTLMMENFNLPYEVDVIITNNENIREINNMHRRIDKETDVLSFPMLDYVNGKKREAYYSEDINPQTGNVILGDIVLSIEKAISQAQEYGHAVNREIAFLTVHSVLHLLGYDHENEVDRTIMRTKEEMILSEIKLSR